MFKRLRQKSMAVLEKNTSRLEKPLKIYRILGRDVLEIRLAFLKKTANHFLEIG